MDPVEREKRTVAVMISMYCRAHHGPDLCPGCEELRDYCFRRIESCPRRNDKVPCNRCGTNCYRQDMRERTRAVMRYSGPRMVLRHPCMAIRHMLS